MQKPVEPEHNNTPATDPEQAQPEATESSVQETETKQKDRYTAEFGPRVNERRQPSAFSVDDFSFRSSTPSPTHWSIGWSDLMMTMFILFLTLFVYQATHKQILVSKHLEVVGGDTTQSVDVATKGNPSAHFAPIKPSLPLITGGTIRKIVPVPMEEIGPKNKSGSGKALEQKKNIPNDQMSSTQSKRPEVPSKSEEVAQEAELVFSGRQPPHPTAVPEKKSAINTNQMHRLFDRISSTITRYDLDKYATIDLISGTMIRVSLTSDLFFFKKTAKITPKSAVLLHKIGEAIKVAPFMIDIVGHTDDQPLHSKYFPSNWEFSTARASSIVRFFIEETEMNPNQFVISGYSSNRPLYPNTSGHNRSANRRVDIIISNHYPETATANNQDRRL